MPIEFSVAAFRLGHSDDPRAYSWNANFDNGAGRSSCSSSSRRERRPRRRHAPRRATGSRTSAGSSTSGGEQPAWSVPAASSTGGADREEDRQARSHICPGRCGLPAPPASQPAPQPRAQEPQAREDGQARDRSADGDVHEEQGRERHEVDERPDPGRQQRSEPRKRAHPGAALVALPADAALVLHPARGGVQRREAQGRRSAHRRGDVPPGDGGEQALDRARQDFEPTLGSQRPRHSG